MQRQDANNIEWLNQLRRNWSGVDSSKFDAERLLAAWTPFLAPDVDQPTLHVTWPSQEKRATVHLGVRFGD